jgi:exonuclease III
VDIAVLQEARAASFEELRDRFATAGLCHFIHSHRADSESGVKRYVAVASRYPLGAVAPVACPAPESTVAVGVDTGEVAFELLGAYIPTIARKDGIKVPTQLALHDRVRQAAGRPLVVCGDFNSPKAESAEGEIELFFRPSRAEEYAGERALMHGLLELGMRDAFRACNGYGIDAPSWFWKNRGRTGGYRLDHIFVSPHFEVLRCWYDHEVRERGLSDHSAMFAEVEVGTDSRQPGT